MIRSWFAYHAAKHRARIEAHKRSERILQLMDERRTQHLADHRAKQGDNK